jgi:glucosamine--fructose-6-phosphate aminotransferase (isomerizing)
MCGIVGYIGYKQAQPILLKSLKRLEYRGYDSCGFAIANSGELQLFKDVGRIIDLEEKLPQIKGKAGIGHTRWATHGAPSTVNAHPHLDCQGRVAVVHNGIIDNYAALKEQLIAEGHLFKSETDTEVIAHLIEKYSCGSLSEAVNKALHDIAGTYAIAVLDGEANEVVVARKENPIVIGVGDKENFIGSDITALLDFTERVIYVEDDDLVTIKPHDIEVTHQNKAISRKWQVIPWKVEEAERAGYEHFMIKEIHEQPQIIHQTLSAYISESGIMTELDIPEDEEPTILYLACGSSYYSSLVHEHIMDRLGYRNVKCQIASEFGFSSRVKEGTWAIGISQSGETADTLEAIKKAKNQGAKTIAITNVVGSTITRVADHTLYVRAGPEISVAATKSFIAQVIIGYLLALSIAPFESYVNRYIKEKLVKELQLVSSKVKQILDAEQMIAKMATDLAKYGNIFIIARGVNYPAALEGALKLKEIAYIHAEAFPAGELKHGPFALLRDNTPVLAIATPDETYQSLLTSIKEVRARSSPVIAIAEEGDKNIEQVANKVIYTPKVEPLLSPITNTVILQLLAYYTAKERGCSIDRPVNLAKSVTVH